MRGHASAQAVPSSLAVCPASWLIAPGHIVACWPYMHPPLKACGVKCARWVASKSETHLWNSLGKSSLLRSSAVKKHGNLLIFPWVTPSPGENLPGDHTQTHTHIQPSSQSSALLFATQEQRIIRHEGFFQLKSDLLGVDVFFWNHYCSSPYSERSRCMMYLTSALG